MRRFLLATAFAVLAVAVASPANAGYLIIRVILDGATTPVPGVGEPGVGVPGFPPPGGAPRVDGGDAVSGRPVGQPPVRPEGGVPGAGADPKAAVPHDATRSLVVIVPVVEDLTKQHPFYKGPVHPIANPYRGPQLHLAHRGEQFVTNLFADNTSVQWYENLKETPAFKRTHAMDLQDRYAKWAKAKDDPKAGLDLVAAALGLGMVDEAVKYADELLASAAKKDGLPPEVAGFVKAYGPIQKGLKAPAPKRGAAETWQAKLDDPKLATSPHYALLYWDATDDEVRRRLAFLEENFKAFFLLHAARGEALRLPEAPLVAVLVKQGSDAIALTRALDGPARLPADGFYGAAHDALVLSPDRLDSVGLTFAAQVQQVYGGGVSRKELLAGRGPKVDANGQNGLKRPDDVARMQTLALVDRLADEAAAIDAISREGTLQLLYAAGRLPRHVALPAWFTNGVASQNARPKDPAFVTDAEGKWRMTVNPAHGYGGVNYVEQRYFRDLLEKKELDPDPAALLRNVITDAYFLGLRDPKNVVDPDPAKLDKTGLALTGTGGAPGGAALPFGIGRPGGQPFGRGGVDGGEGEGRPGVGIPGMPATPAEDVAALLRKKRERLAVKAQATAWALCYYLARDKPAELAKFTAELAALPRDLPLDGPAAAAVFHRAFGLDGSESLARFAAGWLEYMQVVSPAGIDVPLVDPKPAAPAGVPNPMGVPMPGIPGLRPGDGGR